MLVVVVVSTVVGTSVTGTVVVGAVVVLVVVGSVDVVVGAHVVVVSGTVVVVVFTGLPLKDNSYWMFQLTPSRQTSGSQQQVPARNR